MRAARLLALAIVIGWSVSNAWYRITDWSLSDMDAYWNAALRIREGALLYPPLADPSAADVYRYAPWFAWAWIPLTYLPKALVATGWSLILILATVAALRPLMRPTAASIGTAALIGSMLIWATSVGNVQPLMVAVLVHGIDRRSGPLWVGIAASLKAVPIVYVLLYLGRREWTRVVATLAVAALLVAPLLITPMRYYPGGPGDAQGPLWALHPVLAASGLALLAAFTIRLASRGSGYTRLMAASTLLAALPRITLIDLSHLAVAIPWRRSSTATPPPTPPA
jgi:glycosyl transferase family 87